MRKLAYPQQVRGQREGHPCLLITCPGWLCNRRVLSQPRAVHPHVKKPAPMGIARETEELPDCLRSMPLSPHRPLQTVASGVFQGPVAKATQLSLPGSFRGSSQTDLPPGPPFPSSFPPKGNKDFREPNVICWRPPGSWKRPSEHRHHPWPVPCV